MIVDTNDKDHLGEAMSLITIASVFGAVLGPLVGGTVFHYLGYHAVFILALSLITVDTLLRLAVIDQSSPAQLSGGDGTEPLLRADDDHHQQQQNGAAAEYGKKAKGVSSLAIGGALLRNPRFLVAMISYGVIQVLLTSFDTILPLFIIQEFDATAFESGLSFLPITLPALLSRWIGEPGTSLPPPSLFVSRKKAIVEGRRQIEANQAPQGDLLTK